MKAHIGHDYDPTVKAAKDTENDVKLQLDAYERKQTDRLHNAIKVIESTRKDVEAQNIEIAEKVEKVIEELQCVLSDYKQYLLESKSALIRQKINSLDEQKAKYGEELQEIKSSVDEWKYKLENATKHDILKNRKHILNWVEENTRRLYTCLDPVEEADVVLKSINGTEFKTLCQNGIQVDVAQVDASKCVLEEQHCTKQAEVNRPFQIKLSVIADNGHPFKRVVNVQAKIISQDNHSVIEAKVSQTQEQNKYSVSCTPTVRGLHQMEITINDLPVAGSPLPILVKFSPIEYANLTPIRIIELKSPGGIAINSGGEIIVAQPHGGVILLDTKGKLLNEVSRHGNDHHFQQPWGVAVDAQDNIYMTDKTSGHLYKFDKHLQMVKSCQYGQSRRGVTVADETVFVIDGFGQLEIFDTDLKLLNKFTITSPPNDSEYYGLSHDQDGKLYLCHAQLIQIMTQEGQFLGYIGQQHKMYNPHFVCIDDKYVYVTEYHNHCVSIYTKEGTFISSFGRLGGIEGQFERPYGIAFTADGVLCVSDIDNHRLQLF